MALESFYGGKPGFSPVIKASFKYINNEDPAYQTALINNGNNAAALKEYTMDECFKDINYTDVWYGELCIIDTENKMNPNNGKLYRRTLKKTPDDGKWTQAGNTTYAEYIGQIVGPSGGVPNLDLGSLNTERKKAVGIEKTYDTDGNLPLDTSGWDYSYRDAESGQMTNANPQGDISKIKILDAGGINGQNIEMVPGKDGSTYHDTIKYTWCNVRRTLDNSNEDAWIYLGFQIPYTIFDATGQEENYTYDGDIFIDNTASSSSMHPFYKNYTFHIPRGARGIGPEQVFTVNPKDDNSPSVPGTLYDFDAIQYDQNTDTYSIDATKTKQVAATESYWVGMWKLYNPKTTEEDTDTIYQYLGSYKDIREVTLANDGTLTFIYSDNSPQTFSKKIKWIDSITIDTDISHTTQNNNNYGKMTIKYNNGTPSFTKVLPFIKSVNFNDSNGKLTTTYANGTTINVKNSSGEDFTFVYPKTATVDIDKSSNNYGQFQIKSNTGTPILDVTLPLIKEITYNEISGADNGKISVLYSGESTPTVIGDLTYIKSLAVNGTTQRVSVTNNKGTTTQTSAYLNIVKQFWLDPRGHLLALYNSSYYRPTSGTGTNNGLYDEQQANPNTRYTENQTWVKGTATNKIAGTDTTNWWHDLGLVYEKTGVKVTSSYSYNGKQDEQNHTLTIPSEASSVASTLNKEYVNGKIPIGADGIDYSGGFVIVEKIKRDTSDTEGKETGAFYYDYIAGEWKYAGPWTGGEGSSGGNSNIYIIGPKDSYTMADKDTIVADNGITYPADDANDPEIYFVDGRKLMISVFPVASDVPSPDGLSNIEEIITMPPYADSPSII